MFPFSMPGPADPASLFGMQGGGAMGVMRMTVIRTSPQPEPHYPPMQGQPRALPEEQARGPMSQLPARRGPRPLRGQAQGQPDMRGGEGQPTTQERPEQAPPTRLPAPQPPPEAARMRQGQQDPSLRARPDMHAPHAMTPHAPQQPRPQQPRAPQPQPAPREMQPTFNGMEQRRVVIPEAFMRPWELRLSREEAIYDMHAEGRRSRILSLVERVRNKLDEAAELRKWHVMLAGKSADEQLWAVRPPRGGLTDPLVREWARRTLEGAGYDAASMLAEWEIFWRRKGI